ncbi:ribose-phosphate diphosphokinase [Pyrobaculum neutrophilum]|uniref:ribose-phosphate diphosphokinase n=1 Tax=Pyrobaculum neutrophilum (strain DSM 2338 / JCM 9278 / NBRC 100436 / V24Sta) TaxID=444157 RepID=B1YAW5_PYRNV|nr:ribose-phosphate diphosphokinase [Pyrobaculum neutrophilum]ACB40665.1 ribose-phosphate pyrophosphokinase [Pyrobaculum neutrophilum V24Sta]
MDILAFQNAFDIAAEFEGLGEVKQVEERVFPDGEVLVRIPPVGREVALVLRLYPNVNDNFVKLVLALDALSDAGVQRVVLVAPYLPYTRQDRRFRPGEPISSKALLKILGGYPISAVVTLDLHKPYVADYVPRVAVRNLYPATEYAERLSGVDVVVSPDFGSVHRAEAVAKALGVSHTYFEKYRDRETGAIALYPRHDVELRGKKVAIVDDILSTGGTLVDACRSAKTLGAAAVFAAVTHCQLLKDARERVRSCLDKLICTDSILNEFAEVRVGPILRRELERLL